MSRKLSRPLPFGVNEMTLLEAIKAVEKADPVHGNTIATGVLTGACDVFLTEDERNRLIQILLRYAAGTQEEA